MRIVFVTQRVPFPPDHDGLSLIGYHVIEELRQRHAISIVSFGPPSEETKLFEERGIHVATVQTPTTSLRRYAAWPFRHDPWFVYRWKSKAMFQALQKIERDRSTDLVVLHGPFLAGYISVFKNTNVIVHGIDALSDWFVQTAGTEKNILKKIHLLREGRKAERIERTLYPLARSIIVVADHDRHILEHRSLRTRVYTIPNGVDTSAFVPATTPCDANTLLFSGSMDFPPNIEAAVWFFQHVWPLVKERNPETHWIIAGRNPAQQIRSLAQQDTAIEVTGGVPSLTPLFHRATLVIAPLVNESGIKNKLLEASACAKAIVASPQAAAGLSMRDGRDLLIGSGPQDFANKILRLLAAPNERAVLGQAARQFALSRSWSHVAKAYERIYQETMRR